ncbi:MAG TPA: rhomboid family intramembrane serine protease [Solirubrobacteraceae bacterium]|nr:rhomboid family intramembrane serine protease [Solirubrobacteraceae bacterium]
MATCYRHPNRETGVSCSNCGRPICPDCMTPTPVGMRCPECAKQRTKTVRMRDMIARPDVTYALIAINIIAFLTEGNLTLNGGGVGDTVYLKGALLGSSEDPALIGQGVAHGQWWRLITSGFLHENVLHIGFNMLVLYYLGVLLEPAIGHVRFAVVYGVSLLAGSFGALLVSPHVLTVGASGAVFGVMGAAAVEMRARQIPIMQSGVGMLIIVNLVLSFTFSDISWGGHVGGLIGGALVAWLLALGERHRQQALAMAGCGAIAVACVVGSIATSKSSLVEPTAPTQTLQLTPEP